jgi:glycosyltransferase involved in cell wall biosynthesis
MLKKMSDLRSRRREINWVAIFENHPYPFDVRLRPHMEALAAAGYQVTVISMRGQGQSRHEVINGVRVYRFFLPPYGNKVVGYILEFLHASISLTAMTLWVWLRHGLDVLHVYNPPDSLFVAALVPKLAGKTVIFDLRDLAPELYVSKYDRPNQWLYSLLVRLERAACRLADHVITVNESYRKIIIERTGLFPARVSIVRQGPDLDRVHSAEPDSDIRSRARTILAYLGSMEKEDGIDHLLRALHYLDRDFRQQDWFCVLVGQSNEIEAYKRLASELGIEDRILFTGHLGAERWVSVLSAADICIEPAPANPVNNISTTNKIMDYMALGKPSVGYGHCEQRITAGDAALYANPNDPRDMARQIALLIEDPDLRARTGEIGRRRIKEHLAWHHQKERLLTLCGSLAPKGPVKRAE